MWKAQPTNTAFNVVVWMERLENYCTYLSWHVVQNVKGPAFIARIVLVHLKHFFSELLADVTYKYKGATT